MDCLSTVYFAVRSFPLLLLPPLLVSTSHSQVISKFPASVVQAHREVLMLPLLTSLVNDYSPKARTAAGGTLRALLQQLQQPQQDQVATFCAAWLRRGVGAAPAAAAAAVGEAAAAAGAAGSGDARGAQLTRAAAQALCALADVEGPKFGRR